MIKYLVHWLEVLWLIPFAMTPHASGPNTLSYDIPLKKIIFQTRKEVSSGETVDLILRNR